MAVLSTFSFRLPPGLLLAGSLLLGSCTGSPDATNGTGVTALPLNMMAPLHLMAQNSQTLPPTGDLDVYFAQLMRENHRAAVAMSALELAQGRDPTLRSMAEEMNHAHQQLILGLDSAIRRLTARPSRFPEHTTGSDQFARLLATATNGLSPAAHQTIVRAEGGPSSPNLGMREYHQDAGTGSIDRDFAVLLVPHHQNSIELAQAEMEHGEDAGLQKAALLIVRDQQREIDQANAWLTQHPTPVRR
jgi:uncharacterized protein (DUF305 family)